MKPLTENGNLLYKGIVEFNIKAFEVINALALEFNINLDSENPFSKLQKQENKLWKGYFSEWDYCFHGDSCEFINIKTKQFIEVKIDEKKNYGAIESYYLWKFISTTDGIKKETEIFKDPKTRFDTIQELKMKRYLINVGDDVFKIFVLNPDL